MSTTSHYVAVIKVERVDSIEGTAIQHSKRETRTVTNVTISSPSIDSLRSRLLKHIELVEDEGTASEENGKTSVLR